VSETLNLIDASSTWNDETVLRMLEMDEEGDIKNDNIADCKEEIGNN
jgi:hypothetical protein